MKIDLKRITVRELVADYHDDKEGGVRGYGGNLDIRPSFQREFVYGVELRNAVIETIKRGFPLNVMYWAAREDGTYEVIDGQQRTISVAQYTEGDYSLNGKYFFNLQDDEQELILNYELQVYVCDGTDSEKLTWFRIINIAGLKLTDQELRNAVYSGPWVSDAKRYFSRKGAAAPAYKSGSRYVNGRADRQEYLEIAIRWIKSKDQTIEEYMGKHQCDKNAKTLWRHFQAVLNRVEAVFPNYRPMMKGVDWGGLYALLRDKTLDSDGLELEISRLVMDDDVGNKKGIYPYLLTGEEKHLNVRTFTPSMKLAAYERQKGICVTCGKEFKLADMQADHITPWSKGGKTESKNCQVLCAECNRRKSDK